MTEIERLAFAWLEAGDALSAAKPAGKLEANRHYTAAQIALYRALRAAKSVSESRKFSVWIFLNIQRIKLMNLLKRLKKEKVVYLEEIMDQALMESITVVHNGILDEDLS